MKCNGIHHTPQTTLHHTNWIIQWIHCNQNLFIILTGHSDCFILTLYLTISLFLPCWLRDDGQRRPRGQYWRVMRVRGVRRSGLRWAEITISEDLISLSRPPAHCNDNWENHSQIFRHLPPSLPPHTAWPGPVARIVFRGFVLFPKC